MKASVTAFTLIILCLIPVPGGNPAFTSVLHADQREVDADYVLDMDLDDLMKAEVTSVSRYGKLHLDAPAAITIIDNQQIKNSGIRELPELLRLVPGMHVTRLSANFWNISSRELPDMGWGKLLVLIDGRIIYSEDIGATLWETQGITLEDVDRIEVIRGPGGTLWGYNAVNGVVNIITKSAGHTLGFLADTGMADNGSYFAQLRQGMRINDRAHMRIYYNQTQLEAFETIAGEDAEDDLARRRGGIRIDYEPSDTSRLVVAAETAKSTGGENFVGIDSTYTSSQSYLRTKWTETVSKDLSFSLQVYYDKEDYSNGETDAGIVLGTTVENLDGEVQVDWRIHHRHRLMLGGGYRHTHFKVQSSFNPELSEGFLFEDDSAYWQAFNFFLNDEITLIPNKVWLTLGTKLEHNEKTDWGWQPNARVLYKPAPNQSLWASVSKALKRPDFEDATPRAVLYGGPYIDYFSGDPLEDESITAYEVGYRNQISPDLSFDLAGYYNLHDRILLSDYHPISPFSEERVNNYETSATAYGTELSVNWQPDARVNLMGSYAYFHTDYDVLDAWTEDPLEDAERHMVQLHVNYSPAPGVDAAVNTYFATESTYDVTRLKEHMRLDLVLRWRINAVVEASLVGQDLLDDRHSEYDVTSEYYAYDSIDIPRTVYLSLKVAF